MKEKSKEKGKEQNGFYELLRNWERFMYSGVKSTLVVPIRITNRPSNPTLHSNDYFRHLSASRIH